MSKEHKAPINSAEAGRTNSEFDEKTLVCKARLGDGDAFSDLVQMIRPHLLNKAFSMVHDRADAEDVVQTALFQAFKNFGGYRGEAAFSTWLIRITINEGLKLIKKRRSKPIYIHDAGARPYGDGSGWWSHPPQSPEQICAARETMRSFDRWINEINPTYRTILYLRVFEELTYEEISVLLRMPLNSVKIRLYRARRMLRKMVH